MKVLSITYKGNEIARYRVTTPLILIGRSPLCDVLLRAPGVGSVHFIFEWLGSGDFNPDKAFNDEWAMTEVAETQSLGSNEKKANKTIVGQGAVFHNLPLQSGNFVFTWVEDRLTQANLDKKIISQQIVDIRLGIPKNLVQNSAKVLEMISINRELDSVTGVQHFSFGSSNPWRHPLLAQFSAIPELGGGRVGASFTLPSEAKVKLLSHGANPGHFDKQLAKIYQYDVLHVELNNSEYYFRVVPKVAAPVFRRTVLSDPFYIISSFCMLVGALAFYVLFKNAKMNQVEEVIPPRVAQIQVLEVQKPPAPPPPEKKEETAPPKEEKPPEEVKPIKEIQETKPPSDSTAQNAAPAASNVILKSNDSLKVKDAPKVVDKNKGSLDNSAPKAALNRTGFLAALKKPTNVGMVKADQVLSKTMLNDRIKGKTGDFVLEESASGVVNNKVTKEGDALAAASTQLNTNDRLGSGSLNVAKGDITKEGFKSNYGVSGEGGLVDGNFGGQVETQVEGGLDKASVQAAIRGYKSEIRTCYEKALRIKSGVGGRVVYKFQIKPDGKVAWINVHKSDLDSGTLVNCVQTVVNGILFPRAKNGQSTVVIYPFQFARKGNQ